MVAEQFDRRISPTFDLVALSVPITQDIKNVENPTIHDAKTDDGDVRSVKPITKSDGDEFNENTQHTNVNRDSVDDETKDNIKSPEIVYNEDPDNKTGQNQIEDQSSSQVSIGVIAREIAYNAIDRATMATGESLDHMAKQIASRALINATSYAEDYINEISGLLEEQRGRSCHLLQFCSKP